MSETDNRTWEMLFPGEKEKYTDRARWLISRDYVQDISEETLAKQIWQKETEETIDIPSK